MAVVRNMKFRTALRTDKIAGLVTLPYGKKKLEKEFSLQVLNRLVSYLSSPITLH